MSYSLLPFVVLMLSYPDQGWTAVSPLGCSYLESLDGEVTCNFVRWKPPLLDKDFTLEPVSGLKLENIQGSIPAGAFSGLNGPPTHMGRETYIEFHCEYQNLNLSQEIFTPNLHWVTHLDISECCLANGLPSRVMKNLKGLEYLNIEGCGIQGLVSHDALAGLTNLKGIVFDDAPIKDGILPTGFFDGLKNLTSIDMSDAELNLIPPDLFGGLVNVEDIRISHNNLQTLPSGVFDGLHSLHCLELSGNPWNCSCELIWLLDLPQITDVVVCRSDDRSIDLDEVDGLLNCSSIPSAGLSSTRSSLTEMTLLQTLSRTTFAGPDTTLPSTTNLRIPTQEMRLYETSDVTLPCCTPTIANALPSTETDRSRQVNDLRNIVLASTFGVLTLLIVVIALLCRCACQKKWGERLNRVNNDEEGSLG